jgi:hypothetical protein
MTRVARAREAGSFNLAQSCSAAMARPSTASEKIAADASRSRRDPAIIDGEAVVPAEGEELETTPLSVHRIKTDRRGFRAGGSIHV